MGPCPIVPISDQSGSPAVQQRGVISRIKSSPFFKIQLNRSHTNVLATLVLIAFLLLL